MESKPCPHCGQPKHPLKLCAHCGASLLQQELAARYATLTKADVANARVPRSQSGLTRQQPPRPFRSDQDPLADRGQVPVAGPLPESWIEAADNGAGISLNEKGKQPLASPALASRLKKAVTWLGPKPVPTMPIEKLWNVLVFDGWACAATANLARAFVARHPDATLRDVQLALRHANVGLVQYSPIWWIVTGWCKTKALYKDALGHAFIHLDKDWHLAHSLRDMGGLVGGKSPRNPQIVRIPRQGYFICWENEEQAYRYLMDQKNHSGRGVTLAN